MRPYERFARRNAVLPRLLVRRALMPATGLFPPRLLITRRLTVPVIAAARIRLSCFSLLAPFLAACYLLAFFLAARGPLLGGDTALL
jgi:hypothetical protein